MQSDRIDVLGVGFDNVTMEEAVAAAERAIDSRSGGYVVTEDSAHAWCEVYLSGIGWVPFDAAETGRSAMEAARPQEETPASSGSAAGWELPPDIEELMRQLEQQQAAQAQKPPVKEPEPEPEPETPERTPWRRKRPPP